MGQFDVNLCSLACFPANCADYVPVRWHQTHRSRGMTPKRITGFDVTYGNALAPAVRVVYLLVNAPFIVKDAVYRSLSLRLPIVLVCASQQYPQYNGHRHYYVYSIYLYLDLYTDSKPFNRHYTGSRHYLVSTIWSHPRLYYR